MDPLLARACAETPDFPGRPLVTFALALDLLPEPHWSALTPDAPLRHRRLLRLDPGRGLTSAPLHIEERVLHLLAGVNHLDHPLAEILHPKDPPEHMAARHWTLATQTIPILTGPSILHLCGDDPTGQEEIAALVARRSGRQLFTLRLEDLPTATAELDDLLQLWSRDAILLSAILLLQCASTPLTPSDRRLLERLPGPLLLASRDPIPLRRPSQRHQVDRPDPADQKRLWSLTLTDAHLVDTLSHQFRLSADSILTLAAAHPHATPQQLWNACRSTARPRLEDLAERIEPRADWDDLILPDLQKQVLHLLASQCRHRMTVYEDWGFAARGRRGLGLSALFAGPSGTGKTLAAEVLAAELQLDLYRIDLSAVVSKYIGETEKNLKQVFDAAESGGVLLLFDEADALFGKRAEVKDSHDRYANIEVGYLLQRMETFQGLAILTTNLKSSLDKSFQRRLRFTVDFPFPDPAQREAIWARAFPLQTPTVDLHPASLARLNVTGGNIRNIARNAAFLAAEAGTPIAMQHVLHATRMEAVKLERPLSDLEIRGWV
jgi:hypothetical protein